MVFTELNVRVWMGDNVDAVRDPQTGEVNMTELAENAAGAFDMNHEGGPLDDEDHWIWEAALDVAEMKR